MKHLIFDFDGTIADSFDETLAVFQLLRKRKPPLTPQVVEELRGMSMLEVLRTLGLHPWQVPLFLMRGRRHMKARISNIKPFPGVADALAELTAGGHRLYVMSTNSSANIQSFLAAHHLEDYFDGIDGGTGLVKRRALLKFLKQRRLARSECVYIGDETRDIDAALAIKMPVLAVAWGFNSPQVLARHHPAAVVQLPSDLASQIQSLP